MSDELAAAPPRAGEVLLYAVEDGRPQVFVPAEGSAASRSQAELATLERFKQQLVKSGETNAA